MPITVEAESTSYNSLPFVSAAFQRYSDRTVLRDQPSFSFSPLVAA